MWNTYFVDTSDGCSSFFTEGLASGKYYLELEQRKGMKLKQWSGYGESHVSQLLLDKVPLIYVVRILKDIDHSTLSNNLLNFAPKARHDRSFIWSWNSERERSQNSGLLTENRTFPSHCRTMYL